MRVVKEAEARREEIINEAVRLFAEKGFRNTSVNDILEAVKIAKGTFYYHFKSKEELLDYAIESYSKKMANRLEEIAASRNLDAVEKFIRVISEASASDDVFKQRIVAAVHQEGNELLHEKSLIVSVLCLVPLLTRIVEQGATEGVFRTAYPQTTVETLLIASQFMFDERFFASDGATNLRRLKEFLAVTEEMLSAPPGVFSPLLEKLLKEEII